MYPIADCSSAAIEELGGFGDGVVFHDSKDTVDMARGRLCQRLKPWNAGHFTNPTIKF